ncbi:hypothetical protein NGA35_06585 [Pseudomonas stutzeri]|nr:hypothetical protein [Stutzerimonas stutzeri]
MKKHLFCVGAEVAPAAGGRLAETFVSAQLNVYVAANELRDALTRAEVALRRDGYEVTFVRGCWVVDAACNDGFCPADALPSEVSGGLLFSDEVHYGELRELTTANDYAY